MKNAVSAVSWILRHQRHGRCPVRCDLGMAYAEGVTCTAVAPRIQDGVHVVEHAARPATLSCSPVRIDLPREDRSVHTSVYWSWGSMLCGPVTC